MSPNRRHTVPLLLSIADEVFIAFISMVVLHMFGLLNAAYIALLIVALTIVTLIKFRLFPSHNPITGKEALPGKICVTTTHLTPHGFVKYNGELWRAGCLDGEIPKGERVKIVGIDGLTLIVKRV